MREKQHVRSKEISDDCNSVIPKNGTPLLDGFGINSMYKRICTEN